MSLAQGLTSWSALSVLVPMVAITAIAFTVTGDARDTEMGTVLGATRVSPALHPATCPPWPLQPLPLTPPPPSRLQLHGEELLRAAALY